MNRIEALEEFGQKARRCHSVKNKVPVVNYVMLCSVNVKVKSTFKVICTRELREIVERVLSIFSP